MAAELYYIDAVARLPQQDLVLNGLEEIAASYQSNAGFDPRLELGRTFHDGDDLWTLFTVVVMVSQGTKRTAVSVKFAAKIVLRDGLIGEVDQYVLNDAGGDGLSCQPVRPEAMTRPVPPITSETKWYRGTAGNRVALGTDRTKRKFENDVSETSRQTAWAVAVVGVDDQHYLPKLHWLRKNPPYEMFVAWRYLKKQRSSKRQSLEDLERATDQWMADQFRVEKHNREKAIKRAKRRETYGQVSAMADQAAMYSSDPEIARLGMMRTAQRTAQQMQAQQQMAMQQQAAMFAANQQAEDARIEQLARSMAKAMFDEAEARRKP